MMAQEVSSRAVLGIIQICVGGLLWGCVVNLDVGQERVIRCASLNDCPGNLICNVDSAQCVSPNADLIPPEIQADSLSMTPALVGRNATLTIEFEVSKELKGNPELSLVFSSLDPSVRNLDFESSDERTFRFTYSPQGDESAASADLQIVLRDTSNNVSTKSFSLRSSFDFEAPLLVASELTIIPAPGSRNPDPSALGIGAALRVSLTTSETLQGTSRLFLLPSPADSDTDCLPTEESFWGVDLSLVIASGVASQFEQTVPITEAMNLELDLIAHLIDEAGNCVRRVLSTVDFDTQAPSSPDVTNPGATTFVRAPFSGVSGSFSLRGSTAAAPPDATIFAYSDPATTALLGSAPVQNDGSFFLSLNTSDRPTIYVLSSDSAGNQSAASEVQDIEWIGTLEQWSPDKSFPNFSQFFERVWFNDARFQPSDEINLLDSSLLQAEDGLIVESVGAGAWALPGMGYGAFPSGARGPSVIYDPSAGLVRAARDGNILSEQSGVFAEHTLFDPEGDGSPSELELIFDSKRQDVYAFDGSALWRWTGISFELQNDLDASGDGSPSQTDFQQRRTYFDEASSRISIIESSATHLLIWQWFDEEWNLRCDATPIDDTCGAEPSTRSGFAAAYDPQNHQLVVYGGVEDPILYDETWLFDGTSWVQASPSNSPPSLHQAALHYSPLDDALMMYGGCDQTSGCIKPFAPGLEAFWQWQNGAWEERCDNIPAGDTCALHPGPRANSTLLYDGHRRELILLGESFFPAVPGGESIPVIYGWNGKRWHQRSDLALSHATPPIDAHLAAGTYLRPLEFGFWLGGNSGSGANSTLFVYDGLLWDNSSGTLSIPPRFGATATAEQNQSKAWVFGGCSDQPCGSGESLNDLWEVSDASNQVQRCDGAIEVCGTQPLPRVLHSAAEMNNSLFVFGGCDFVSGGGVTTFGDFWEWNDTQWIERCDGLIEDCGSLPPPRKSAVMLQNPGGGLLLFGGIECSSGTRKNDTWVFDGTAWTQICDGSDGDGCNSPLPRHSAAHWYDSNRDKVVMTGGECTGASNCSGIFEWDGTTWSERAVSIHTNLFGPESVNDGFSNSQPAIFNANASRSAVFEKASGPDTEWFWLAGNDAYPGHIFSTELAQITFNEAADVNALEVDWRGGGVGDITGTPTPGATLAVWRGGHFMPITTSVTASPSAIETLSWSENSFLDELFVDDAGVLSLSLTPLAPNGQGAAVVATDALEVRIRYRRR